MKHGWVRQGDDEWPFSAVYTTTTTSLRCIGVGEASPLQKLRIYFFVSKYGQLACRWATL